LFDDFNFSKALLYARALYSTNDSLLYVAVNNKVFEFKKFNLLHRYVFPDKVFSISAVNGKVIAAVVANGFYVIENGQATPASNSLSKTTITSFLKDSEGNFWVTTLEKGLFVARNTAITTGYHDEVAVTRLLKKMDWRICCWITTSFSLLPISLQLKQLLLQTIFTISPSVMAKAATKTFIFLKQE